MKATVGIKVHNHFDFELKNTLTGDVKKYRSYNVVVDPIRYSYYSDRSPMNIICIGDGSGIPKETDTGLFHMTGYGRTTNSQTISDGKNGVLTLTLTILETQGNGNITEVGIGRYNTYYGAPAWSQTSAFPSYAVLSTHSVITDAEGNPIAITKTDTDILTVTATFYASVASDSSLTLRYFRPSTGVSIGKGTNQNNIVNCACGGTPNYRYSSLTATYSLCLSGVTRPPYTNGQININTNLPPAYGIGDRYYPFPHNNGPVTDWLLAIRGSMNILSNEANSSHTILIKSIIIEDTGFIELPNQDIFPTMQLSLDNVLTGDGIKTSFDLPVPELKTEGAEVYIDGVMQSPSSYTFNGKNYTLPQAWESNDTRYLQEDTGYVITGTGMMPFYPNYNRIGHPYGGICTATASRPIVYDFEKPISVNAICPLSVTNPIDVYLDYSQDGFEWENAAVLPKGTPYIAGNDYMPDINNAVLFSEITARYWRFRTTIADNVTSVTNNAFAAVFGNMKPGLVFNTPPAAGSLISVKAHTDYPIKNDHWKLNVTVDLFLSRVSE